MTNFPMRLDDIWRALLLIIGANKNNSYIELDEEALSLNYGFFKTRVPLTQIEAVNPMKWPWYFGVGLRLAPGPMIGLIGSTQEVVEIRLRGDLEVKVPFKIKAKNLAVSIEGHRTFVDELQKRLVAMKSVPR
jgi:hypothetical protein